MNFICLAAQFYVALWPVGGPNFGIVTFFQDYLAAPFLLFLYIIWKVWSFFKHPEQRPLYVKIKDIDIYTGMREGQLQMISGQHLTADQRKDSIMEIQEEKKKGAGGWALSVVRAVF